MATAMSLLFAGCGWATSDSDEPLYPDARDLVVQSDDLPPSLPGVEDVRWGDTEWHKRSDEIASIRTVGEAAMGRVTVSQAVVVTAHSRAARNDIQDRRDFWEGTWKKYNEVPQYMDLGAAFPGADEEFYVCRFGAVDGSCSFMSYFARRGNIVYVIAIDAADPLPIESISEVASFGGAEVARRLSEYSQQPGNGSP